ncbi:MAG: hypothetical protein BHV77_16805 [Bacteroides sp. 43_108]|nr:MAG: hypothetical protein BHV77_16805 [Bacteroides sp. 43_108]
MIVYHGSIEQVEKPEIREANRALDYGNGFYTTTSEEQAVLWVRRKLKGTGSKGYVNIYEWNEASSSHLNVLHFKGATEEWLDFVMGNRMDMNYHHAYDIVWGPVANDRVYAAFALYEGGLLNKQELIKELKTYVLVDQLLFHTSHSLACLKFKEAKEVSL